MVQKGVVDVRDAEGKHGWRVGGVQVHSSGKRVVVTVSSHFSHHPGRDAMQPRVSES